MTKRDMIQNIKSIVKKKLLNYGLSASILFKNLDGAAGMAIWGENNFIVINRKFLTEENYHYIIKEVVPHEVAHIIVGNDKRNLSEHGKVWREVNKSLGGSGKIYHEMT